MLKELPTSPKGGNSWRAGKSGRLCRVIEDLRARGAPGGLSRSTRIILRPGGLLGSLVVRRTTVDGLGRSMGPSAQSKISVRVCLSIVGDVMTYLYTVQNKFENNYPVSSGSRCVVPVVLVVSVQCRDTCVTLVSMVPGMSVVL